MKILAIIVLLHFFNAYSHISNDNVDTADRISSIPAIDSNQINTLSPSSKYAYVTLLDGIDADLKYRGLVLSILVMQYSLKILLRSTADLVVLYGYSADAISKENSNDNSDIIESDLSILRSFGIQLYRLTPFKKQRSSIDSVLDTNISTESLQYLSQLHVTLHKIEIWSLEHYQRIQFLDADVMPIANMDCFFHMPHVASTSAKQSYLLDLQRTNVSGTTAFEVGWRSPINAGWALLTPNNQEYKLLRSLAEWRIFQVGENWNVRKGYGLEVPKGVLFIDPPKGLRHVNSVNIDQWDFYGAYLEQGLLVHYFALLDRSVALCCNSAAATQLVECQCNIGGYDGRSLVLIDRKKASIIRGGNLLANLSLSDLINSCNKELVNIPQMHVTEDVGSLITPTARFIHFVGASKPWLHDDLNTLKNSVSRKLANKTVSNRNHKGNNQKHKVKPKSHPKQEADGNLWTRRHAMQKQQRQQWARRLDALHLNVNSSNIVEFLKSRNLIKLMT